MDKDKDKTEEIFGSSDKNEIEQKFLNDIE